ncbi:MAG: NAD(P)H-hydrate epimerase [Cyclobacteriaceae bacterium]|nr:NAD(P)H-hydrate epimerase [Cyclobacteriaceae bacterium]
MNQPLKYIPGKNEILNLDQFRQLDYEAVKQGLSISLMMEQAGFHLANRAVALAGKGDSFLVGVGPGNNGGGGLVAARRLKAWGYHVSLHLPFQKGNALQQLQLQRALDFGVEENPDWESDVFIDAYLGFSQKLPLSAGLVNDINKINRLPIKRIALDLPTGIGGSCLINADSILCLAAPKTILEDFTGKVPVWVADLGIPFSIYEKYGFLKPLPFSGTGIFQWSN